MSVSRKKEIDISVKKPFDITLPELISDKYFKSLLSNAA
jgi:hypothetical protein